VITICSRADIKQYPIAVHVWQNIYGVCVCVCVCVYIYDLDCSPDIFCHMWTEIGYCFMSVGLQVVLTLRPLMDAVKVSDHNFQK
jgi:hypothetical protein